VRISRPAAVASACAESTINELKAAARIGRPLMVMGSSLTPQNPTIAPESAT